ncbi:DNA cytosine methyltransferase [Arthrobacter zhaoguopingii]|uniref:DNA cytosine methyltransferase n=1 Tax=Arthrobacter zhaoguopingii TaxID=2681491 RepID=UPI00135BB31B|nr:DNA cytosine methyltransferase [Arthrobacter zhaoguopingii]
MFPLIDLFAGPGGLNEGFSSVTAGEGEYAFENLASFEMDAYACETLRLRETFRHLTRTGADTSGYFDYILGRKPWSEIFQGAFAEAYSLSKDKVYRKVLGEDARPDVDNIIRQKLAQQEEGSHWALIGGPPCQAYSLAGRSRRTGDATFASDHKHFLYREYLHILSEFKPTIFVMENVKGLLSSKNGDDSMFQTILADLSALPSGVRYEIRSLVVDKSPSDLAPSDFIIRAEEYGVPQKRHRVILLGVRSDVASLMPRRTLQRADGVVTVREAVADLPAVTAATSNRAPKAQIDWAAAELAALEDVAKLEPAQAVVSMQQGQRAARAYSSWIRDSNVHKPAQHQPRPHMVSDLVRYRVMTALAERLGKSPKYTDLPSALHPEHSNVTKAGTPFTDRFRVQVWDAPSTTIVSHISKDGHYYIHPEKEQARSFTVREAARLQTFPDNYFFEGPRTQQFHQVGNAVPPLLAKQIGDIVAAMLSGVKG